MMGAGKRGKYALQKGIATGQRSAKWIGSQVAPTAAAMIHAGLASELFSEIEKARKDIKPLKIKQFEFYKKHGVLSPEQLQKLEAAGVENLTEEECESVLSEPVKNF